MDKYTADLAKQKTDFATKQKAQAGAKTTLDGLIASKQKPAEAKLAEMTKAAVAAPVAKAAADKALAGVNAEVKTALMAFLAAETAAQSDEAAAAGRGPEKPRRKGGKGKKRRAKKARQKAEL